MEYRSYGRKIAWVNGSLIAVNILYFLYLELLGSTENTMFMMKHGAMFVPLVLEEHQYYRLVSSLFMHFGIDHLVNNMMVLFVLGDNLERALGKIKYLIFYLLCGIGANVVSMIAGLRSPIWAVGAGASGAIFGVVGGLICAVTKNRGRLEDLSTRQLVIMAAFSLYIGFVSQGVDNAAHVGGLVCGLVLGAFMYRPPKPSRELYVWR